MTPKRATIRTSHARPGLVADAVRPDNTDRMTTAVEGDRVVTTVERESTGGLRATVDDYVVNLGVAARIADGLDRSDGADPDADRPRADDEPETSGGSTADDEPETSDGGTADDEPEADDA